MAAPEVVSIEGLFQIAEAMRTTYGAVEVQDESQLLRVRVPMREPDNSGAVTGDEMLTIRVQLKVPFALVAVGSQLTVPTTDIDKVARILAVVNLYMNQVALEVDERDGEVRMRAGVVFKEVVAGTQTVLDLVADAVAQSRKVYPLLESLLPAEIDEAIKRARATFRSEETQLAADMELLTSGAVGGP